MPSSVSSSEQHTPPFRVLVADPDADTRALYQQSFALAGCDVVEASDGRDALTKALVHPPALVVTELRLPFIDGFALCEILRRDRATATVPILVVTAEARAAELERVEHVGADAVLVKPTTPDVLLSTAQALRQKSATLQGRSAHVRARADERIDRSGMALARSFALPRTALVKSLRREITTTPPRTPPTLTCPSCDRTLTYEFSHVGGVSERHLEQWDYFRCGSCGRFQYRHRTRKLRSLTPDEERWVTRMKNRG